MNNKLSKNIYILRKKYQLTQEQFGVKIGISNKTVSKWELGEIVPDISYLIIICEIFNISLDVLVKGNIYQDEKVREEEAKEKEKYNNILLNMIIIFLALLSLVTSIFVFRNGTVLFLLNTIVSTLLVGYCFYQIYRNFK